MKKIAGIYKITSPSGRVYIGQSKDIDHRFYRYRTYQCKKQPRLYYSLMKYGSGSHTFEIVYLFPPDVTRDITDNYEQFVIAQFKEAGTALLNMNEGGLTNKELSPETRKKLSESATGKKYWLGRKHTEEAKNKIRLANTGVKFTEDRLRKMSEGNKGKPSPMKGKKMSNETKAKLSAARKGKRMPKEVRMKIKASVIRAKMFKARNQLKIWPK